MLPTRPCFVHTSTAREGERREKLVQGEAGVEGREEGGGRREEGRGRGGEGRRKSAPGLNQRTSSGWKNMCLMTARRLWIFTGIPLRMIFLRMMRLGSTLITEPEPKNSISPSTTIEDEWESLAISQ